MYIAIEGVKGTGKSTVFQALCERIDQRDIPHQTLIPTQPMPRFHVWEMAAHCKTIRAWDAFKKRLYHVRSLYHCRRIDWQAPLVLGERSLLTSIVTRWPSSSCADTHHDYIERTAQSKRHLPWPDVVIYLQAPMDVLQQRLTQRQRTYGLEDECPQRLLETTQAYQSVRHYTHQRGMDMAWHTVNAAQPKSAVLEQVLNIVNRQKSVATAASAIPLST